MTQLQDLDDRTSGYGATGDSRQESAADTAALIDRVHKLRILLPTMAQETAVARREVARLRSQNAKLQRRVEELEARDGDRAASRPADATSHRNRHSHRRLV